MGVDSNDINAKKDAFLAFISERQRTVYLPKEKTMGRPGMDERLFLDALIFIVREGCSWRSIPAAYGKWNSIYKEFRSWESQNIFQRIYFCLMGLCDPNADGLVLIEQIYYVISIDSTSNNAQFTSTYL